MVVVEEMLMILPLPWLFIVGTTARQAKYIPLTFTSMQRSHSSSGNSSRAAGGAR